MNTLRCHNCGQANPIDATFCSKCATSLRRSQLQRAATRKIFVPPPHDEVPTPLPTTPVSTGVPAIIWLLGIIVVAGAVWLIWFLG